MGYTKEDSILLLKGQIRNDVRSIFYSEKDGHYHVTFSNGKRFFYNKENAVTLLKCEDLPMPVRVTRRSDGMVFQDIHGVTIFRTPDSCATAAFRVIFENGEHRDYLEQDLLVEKHVKGERARSVYNYLRDLSKFSRIAVDDETTISLHSKYERVQMISEVSPLADYLTFKEGKSLKPVMSDGVDRLYPIFPFGCNRSQYNAVRNALGSKISVIQGPPGTGKTQTILNIVANLVIAGKSIEIVSNNNSAVLNVREKLQKEQYGLDWLVAYLGNSQNKGKFYDTQKGVYPSLESWKTDLDTLRILKLDITQLAARLQRGYENMERLSVLKEYLRQTEIQKVHAEVSGKEDLHGLRRISGSQEALHIIEKIDDEMEKKGRLRWFTRLRLRRNGITNPEEGVRSLKKAYYCMLASEIASEIRAIETEVKSIRENEKRLVDLSIRYLHGMLFSQFKPEGQTRSIFNQAEVERFSSGRFLKEYPIVLSTTFSATTNIQPSVPFDYLIMDEASQVDVSAGALALNSARNAVIVGDLKQLPNVVTEDERIAAGMLFQRYNIPQSYEFTTNSFLSSLCSLSKDIPSTLLKEHYRCSPAIIGFCNQQFYNGQLIAMTGEGNFPSLMMASTGEGNFARGAVNQRQAEMIAKEIVPEVMKTCRDIGIIAPYNEQVRTIRSELARNGIEDIPVATVHKFQGRENDAIILSTVDNQIRSFVDDPHLLNVAVSRAKKLFVLVVSGNDQPSSNVKDLVDYISYSNGQMMTTRIRSVFDLLYTQMSERRKAFLSRHKTVSRFASENIMFALLEDIMKEERFSRLGILHNYHLRDLVTDTSMLAPEEEAFALKSWSHIDFLIYDKVTHAPVLAIEVDGTSFHFKGSDQSRRDTLKDEVLRKIGLPSVRLSTDGSSERERITSTLDKIILAR